MVDSEAAIDILDQSDSSVLVNESDWILIEDSDDMNGVSLFVDARTGETTELSTRRCRDEQRWNIMPSLEKYSKLQKLDLHNSRYISTLHESVKNLSQLRRLVLTRCWALKTLPSSLGRLCNLQEVSCENRSTIEMALSTALSLTHEYSAMIVATN